MKKFGAIIAVTLTLSPGLAAARDIQYDIRVDGLTCPFCVATSERALKRMDGVHAVSTDLQAGLISVCADDSVTFTGEQLTRLFLERGFTYRSHRRRETCAIEDNESERTSRGQER